MVFNGNKAKLRQKYEHFKNNPEGDFITEGFREIGYTEATNKTKEK